MGKVPGVGKAVELSDYIRAFIALPETQQVFVSEVFGRLISRSFRSYVRSIEKKGDEEHGEDSGVGK